MYWPNKVCDAWLSLGATVTHNIIPNVPTLVEVSDNKVVRGGSVPLRVEHRAHYWNNARPCTSNATVKSPSLCLTSPVSHWIAHIQTGAMAHWTAVYVLRQAGKVLKTVEV